MTMNTEQNADLAYTIAHFKEIARQNRFAENSTVEHDTARCLICHPELSAADPFVTYLRVITESIKIRRPNLGQSLVDEINNDLALVGSTDRVSLDDLIQRDDQAVQLWGDWLRSAIETGLQLLSVHSGSSLEFDLDEAEADGWSEMIRGRIEELMACQAKGS